MTDNKNVLKVLQGFTELSDSEKRLFLNELTDYVGQTSNTQFITKQNIKLKLRSSLGPTNDNSCPCCGRN